MTDLAKANPRPWRPNHDPRWSIAEIVAANGIKVARGVHPIDAALIAAAVNAYDPTRDDPAALDALIAALELALGTLVDRAPDEQIVIQRGQLALAKAASTKPSPERAP